MKKNGKKHFLDTGKLQEVIRLRRHGVSCEFVAFLFQCHKSSIIRRCRKFGVVSWQGTYYPLSAVSLALKNLPEAQQKKIRHHSGKTYDEYLEEMAYRKRHPQNMHLYVPPPSGTMR